MADTLTKFLSLLATPLRPAFGQGFEIAKKIREAQAKPGQKVTLDQSKLDQSGLLGEVAKSQQVGQGVNPFLTEAEKQNQLMTTAKGLAGAATYAVPFGKGANLLSKVLAPGAAVGALGAASEPVVTPGSIALSAAGGASGAGLLHGGGVLASKAGGGLVRAGEKLVDKSVANFMKTSPAVFQKAADAGININKAFQKYFKPSDKIDDLLGAIDKKSSGKLGTLIKESESVINKTIDNYGNDIVATADDLIKPLNKQLEKIKGLPGNSAKVESLTAFIDDVKRLYPEGLTARKLLEVKRIFDEQFGASVVDDTTGAVIRDAQKSIANTSRKILKNTFGTIKNALDNESELYTLRPILNRARATAQTTGLKQPGGLGLIDVLLGLGGAAAGSPLVGAGLIAGKRALQSPTALNVAGKTAQAVGNVRVPASNLLTQILNQAVSRTGAETLPALISPKQQQVSEQQTQNQPSDQVAPPNLSPEKQRALDIINQAEAQAMGGQQSQSITGFTTDQLGKAFAAALMAGDTKSATQLKSMLDLEMAFAKEQGGGKLTTAEKSAQAAQVTAKDALTILQNNKDLKVGLLETPIQQTAAKLGKADQKTLEFNTMIGGLKAMIAKARAGTSFTPNEEKLLNTYVPVAGDSRQQLETKLKLLQTPQGKSALETLMNPPSVEQSIQALQNQGITL